MPCAEEEVTVSVDDVVGTCRVVPKGYPTSERAGCPGRAGQPALDGQGAPDSG